MNLKPCPFCGCAAVITPASEGSMSTLGCTDDLCIGWNMVPLDHGTNLKLVVSEWNRRAADSEDASILLLREVLNAGDNDGVWVNNWQDIRRRIREHLLKPQEGRS